MKKGLIVVIISIIILAGFVVYFLIPSPIIISGKAGFNTSSFGAYRKLSEQDLWDKWAPGDFIVAKKLNGNIIVDVKNKNTRLPVSILLVPASKDSVTVLWNGTFPIVNNPVSRITQYSTAIDIKTKMQRMLENFQSYVSHNENIYGTRILETSTKDTFLIATRFNTSSIPTTARIYAEIEKLKSRALSSGAKEAGFPMLNVSTTDSITFNCMVALPINKILDENGSIFFVRMVPGRFLTSEVTGGPYTIAAAHQAMDQYFKDFNRVSMAIPFEYLVTDRQKETDTTKWVTRIYGPVY